MFECRRSRIKSQKDLQIQEENRSVPGLAVSVSLNHVLPNSTQTKGKQTPWHIFPSPAAVVASAISEEARFDPSLRGGIFFTLRLVETVLEGF